MSRKKSKVQERSREEFAFDLTPDVNDGGSSAMHRRAERSRSAQQSDREANSAPDDVEWGPSVRGHDFRVN